MLSTEKCRSLFWTCTMHCCAESWNHHHSSTRKGCQYVPVALNTGSVYGQFLIQTHSLFLRASLLFFCYFCILFDILREPKIKTCGVVIKKSWCPIYIIWFNIRDHMHTIIQSPYIKGTKGYYYRYDRYFHAFYHFRSHEVIKLFPCFSVSCAD